MEVVCYWPEPSPIKNVAGSYVSRKYYVPIVQSLSDILVTNHANAKAKKGNKYSKSKPLGSMMGGTKKAFPIIFERLIHPSVLVSNG